MQEIQRRDEDTLDAGTAERLRGRLRTVRHLRGLTLQALADAAGCSQSLLSKIENGKAIPSLPTLDRLSRVLETGIGSLVDERDAPVRARRGTPSSDHLLSCRMLHMDPGASRIVEPDHGGEAALYIVGGKVELVVGDDVHGLEAGEAFSFRPDGPLSLRNVGSGHASVFWVDATPPA